MAQDSGVRRLAVDDAFRMPSLGLLVPKRGRLVTMAPLAQRTTYFDTDDLGLTRAGIVLAFQRTGDSRPDGGHADAEALPWSLTLPGITVHRSGGSAAVPADLASVLTVYTRGAALAPAAVVRTSRVRYELRGAKDRLLAVVCDDRVSVLQERRIRSRFRELILEGGSGLGLTKLLRKAGASSRKHAAKHIRALGPAAAGPPDLPPPAPVRSGAGIADTVTNVLRSDIERIFTSDPLVRLHLIRSGADAVQQMRVAVARLRADLKTVGSLLDRDWVAHLRGELGWLASALGAAQDAEALRIRLRHTASLDPVAPLDEAALARIDADLAARHEDAVHGLDVVLASPRYLALVDDLLTAANDPPAIARHRGAGMDRLVARAYHRLAVGNHAVPGARDLTAGDTDEAWHRVCKHARYARYATEAATGLDERAPHLAHALADVADLLGEHEDAVVAARTWIGVATDDPDDHALAITAGRLAERERARARHARDRYPRLWSAADRGKLTKWLR